MQAVLTMLIVMSNAINLKASLFVRKSKGIADLTSIVIPTSSTDVRFASNQITEIPAGYFEGLPLLETINIKENKISRVADHAFSQVPSLTALNLNINELQNITKNMLTGNGLPKNELYLITFVQLMLLRLRFVHWEVPHTAK